MRPDSSATGNRSWPGQTAGTGGLAAPERWLVLLRLRDGRAGAYIPGHSASAIAAEPRDHRLHYWPAAPYVAGFAHGARLAEARDLLATLTNAR